MFKKRQVVKHYWVITKSVPNPQEGLVLLTAVNVFLSFKICYYLIFSDSFVADIQIVFVTFAFYLLYVAVCQF